MAVAILNLVVPGSGLILRDRVGPGLALLVPVLAAAGVALALGLIGTPALAGRGLLLALVVYALAALAAGWLWAQSERSGRLDAAELRRRHRLIAEAYLAGEAARAVAEARQLCRLAPGRSGPWRLLAVVAQAAGDAALAGRAARQARRRQGLEA